MSNRDWTEDFPHENGNYVHECIRCGEQFLGHKRRATCKRCVDEINAVREEQLRRNLEAYIVRNVGANGREYASPYWHCGFCQAMHQSPIAFEHKPDCMLAPTAGAPKAEDVARDAVEVMRLRCQEAARIACLTLPEADHNAQQRARLHVTAAIEKLRHQPAV